MRIRLFGIFTALILTVLAGWRFTRDYAADGQPLSVRFARWRDANPEHKYQEQPFGRYLCEF